MNYTYNYATEFKKRANSYWERAVSFANGNRTITIDQPYQVEVQPLLEGVDSCKLRCVDCHGQFQRHKDGLPAEVYTQLFDDLKLMGVPSVVLSGNYSDPSTNKPLLISILNQIGPTWGVKLHTYGYELTEDLQDAIISAAEKDPLEDSYITISKLAVDQYSDLWLKMCRPTEATITLLNEEIYLQKFFDRTKNLDNLTVRLNCRLTKINGTVENVTGILRWLEEVSDKVSIRFTTDYIPAHTKKSYLPIFTDKIWMDETTAWDVIRQAIDLSGFSDHSRLHFRPVDDFEFHPNQCYNSLLFSAIGTSGHCYMCQGFASTSNLHLSYGCVREDRFPLIWERFIENYDKRCITGCEECPGECERYINLAIKKEVQHGEL